MSVKPQGAMLLRGADGGGVGAGFAMESWRKELGVGSGVGGSGSVLLGRPGMLWGERSEAPGSRLGSFCPRRVDHGVAGWT